MNTSNFASILDAPAADAVRPPALPAGEYVCQILGMPRRDKSSKKQTDFVEFTYKIAQPMESVDQDELQAYGDWQSRTFKLTFYITEKSGYRLREFLEDDLKLDLDSKSLWEAAQDTGGAQFIASMRQVPTEDGKGMYHEVASTAAVE